MTLLEKPPLHKSTNPNESQIPNEDTRRDPSVSSVANSTELEILQPFTSIKVDKDEILNVYTSSPYDPLEKQDDILVDTTAAAAASASAAAAVVVGPPPDGGTRAWLQVIAGFFLFFNSWGVVNTFGVFQTYYKQDLLKSNSSSSISWIGSIQGFLVVNGSLIVGPLIDMGYARHVVLSGCVILTFGMMMTSLGTQYYQILLAQGIVVGVGCSCAFVSSVAVISSYFSKKRAFAMGLCASGSSLGGVIYPIMTYNLIPRVGFPWTARIIGFMIFGSTLIASLLLTPRLPPRKAGPLVDWVSFKDLTFMLLSFGILFGFAGLYIPFFYVQTYALSIGVDEKLAFYLLSILNAGSIFGRIIPNFVADKIGPFNVIAWCSGSCTILLLCWIRIKDTAGLTVFCILYGFCSGAFVSVPPACLAKITPDLSIIGARMGLSFFICAFGLLIGSPVAGAIIKTQNGTFWGAQLFSGLMMAIAFALVMVAKLRVSGGNFFTKA